MHAHPPALRTYHIKFVASDGRVKNGYKLDPQILVSV
jgi:hypothetical protein